MKLGYSVAANGRNQMHERQRRARAVTESLRARYPDLTSLRLEFDFRDSGPFTPVPQVTVMHPAARAYFVFPCPYSDCDGEFDLTEPIANMTRAEESSCAGQLHCMGHRSLGRQGRGQCGLMLEFQVEAQRG
jgi:hypothetical protein